MQDVSEGTVHMSDQPWLVVGLGNPGSGYAGNRHNLGHMVLDVLAGRAGARFARHPRAQAAVAEARLGMLPGGVPGRASCSRSPRRT